MSKYFLDMRWSPLLNNPPRPRRPPDRPRLLIPLSPPHHIHQIPRIALGNSTRVSFSFRGAGHHFVHELVSLFHVGFVVLASTEGFGGNI